MTNQVNFGDELVSPEEKTRRVGNVFSSVCGLLHLLVDVAPLYDVYHIGWIGEQVRQPCP